MSQNSGEPTEIKEPEILTVAPASAPAKKSTRKSHPGLFKKGQSGNPGGRPKEYKEFKELARAEGPENIRKLCELRDTSPNEQVVIAAVKELNDRGFGKAAQAVDVTSKGESVQGTKHTFMVAGQTVEF